MVIYKTVQLEYDDQGYNFQRKLNRYAEAGWKVVSAFRPDNSWTFHVVVLLEKKALKKGKK